MINWRRIWLYAVAFVAVRVLLGLLEGFFFPSGISILWGLFASFAAAIALFSLLAARQSTSPFMHAFVVLAITFLADIAIYMATATSGPALPWAFLALSWACLTLGAAIGAVVGVVASRRRREVRHHVA
jgi:hypothetical protein